MSIVQAKLLGGFGNMLHQYVACRKYAETIGAELEVEWWVGKDIFGLPERPWSRELREVNDGGCGCPPVLTWGETDIRLGGYFQFQKWIALLSRAELRRWLVVRPQLLDVYDRSLPYSLGPYTAAHAREGDYLQHPLFANVPDRSYERACREHNLGMIHRWSRTDTPRHVDGIDPRYSFLPDFLVLLCASVLLRANSTFSWWAATLGDADVYAPVVGDHVGEYDADFVRGNWPRCAHTDRTGVMVEDLRLPP